MFNDSRSNNFCKWSNAKMNDRSTSLPECGPTEYSAAEPCFNLDHKFRMIKCSYETSTCIACNFRED